MTREINENTIRINQPDSIQVIQIKKTWGDNWEVLVLGKVVGTIAKEPLWTLDWGDYQEFSKSLPADADVYSCYPYGHTATIQEAVGRLLGGWCRELGIIPDPDAGKKLEFEYF